MEMFTSRRHGQGSRKMLLDEAKKKNMFVSCNPTDRVKIVPTRNFFSRILKIGDFRKCKIGFGLMFYNVRQISS